MKKIIVSLVAIATLTVSASAQTRRNNNHLSDSAQSESRKHFKKPGHKMMDEALELSGEQKEQMKAINVDIKNKMKALKSSNLSTEEYNSKKAELFNDRKQKMAALLTPEQKAKLEQVKKEQHGKGKKHAEARKQNMKENLALSNDQLAKLKEQRETFKAKFEAIKNNQALSADEKKSQFKTLKEEQKNSFRNILTAEQARKMEDMKQKRS